ncbi:MAG: NfeD family protein [Bacilli bacterium]|nr:NfeD family protein [Bacilli bacterium]
MAYMWLIIIILLIIVEVMTINLTTIWFVISGLFALLLSFFTDNFFIQFFVFTIGGIVLLIVTRPILKNIIKEKKESTNLDRVIGMTGIVTEKIKKNATGEVKVDGKRWTAFANQNIDTNSTVKVLEIDGVKLKVEKVEE